MAIGAAVASAIGVGLDLAFQPGRFVDLTAQVTEKVAPAPIVEKQSESLLDLVVSLIPKNPFTSIVNRERCSLSSPS